MKFLITYFSVSLMMAQSKAEPTWKNVADGKVWTTSDNGSGVSWSQAAYYCRTLTLGGVRDWRLPSIDELQELVSASPNASGYRIAAPIKLTGWQWSSTPGVEKGEGWALDFGDGGRASVVAGDSGLNRAVCVHDSTKRILSNMTEQEILFRISNLVNGFLSFDQAVERIRLLLQHAAEGKALVIETPHRSTGIPEQAKLLDSLDQPYRSLYTLDLRHGRQTFGKATLCFASNHFQGPLPERLANFVGQQLTMLFVRTRLAERQAGLKTEIERIENDLATRKLMQRAEGILVATCGMPPAFATRWIAEDSLKTGLSETAVADSLIATYQPSIWSFEKQVEDLRAASR